MQTVFVNGTVGVGKSTVAEAMSAAEASPHAVLDLDAIRSFYPAPDGDPFNVGLELRNLAALAANYRAAGAQRLILAGVIERRDFLPRYEDAVGGRLRVVRLVASPGVIAERLRARHSNDPAGLAWHLERAGQLSTILDALALGESVEAGDATPSVVAARVAERAWG